MLAPVAKDRVEDVGPLPPLDEAKHPCCRTCLRSESTVTVLVVYVHDVGEVWANEGYARGIAQPLGLSEGGEVSRGVVELSQGSQMGCFVGVRPGQMQPGDCRTG